MQRKVSLSSAVVVIALVMLLAGVQGLAWAQGGSGCVPGSSSYHSDYISFFDDDSIIGAIEGNNNNGVNYKSGGGDFAELLAAVEGLEPGDVLVIGPDGKLTRSTEPYQASVVGVYSTAPAVLGSAFGDEDGKESGKVPLAIMGVVPVKASAENGPIRPGDLLTTASKAGHAMRADPITVNGVSFYPSGVIIGKALEGLEKGTGVIKMLVMLQ